ncbi:Peptidoglycan-N-acetylmuramic acid deacetylase PdaC [Caloramator mitchellensis]|uniref:Peptidoglycan-N-acetylmuramic acid deacetylase PdaC n=1 Tax=Caloramator mitchellensis TaxID=908809 RepID=A0A0R3K387_CALMK|nr:DUF3298 and DUF4163 domain-containing protein [Caloramator mitchellensis]KRQ87876.1 Peptidoglycan-N-acetylmuramic acid deacetylase PdaC [Caloramator mitchellensis]
MKKIISALLIISIALINTGNAFALDQNSNAKEECKVTVRNFHYEKVTDVIKSNLDVPNIIGLKNLRIQRKINAMFIKDIFSFSRRIEKMALKAQKDGVLRNPYEAYTRFKVAFNCNCILSIPVTFYEYTGGAHGNTVIKAYNLNLKNGKTLGYKDIFKKGFDYKTIIVNEIQRQIKENKNDIPYFDDALDTVAKFTDEQPFYITSEGLVVYYGLYELAPYVAGIQEFTIPYSLLKDGLNEDLIKP